MLTDLIPPINESAELTQWHLWLINYSEVQYLRIGEMVMYIVKLSQNRKAGIQMRSKLIRTLQKYYCSLD
jgi:hypothetical protein